MICLFYCFEGFKKINSLVSCLKPFCFIWPRDFNDIEMSALAFFLERRKFSLANTAQLPMFWKFPLNLGRCAFDCLRGIRGKP